MPALGRLMAVAHRQTIPEPLDICLARIFGISAASAKDVAGGGGEVPLAAISLLAEGVSGDMQQQRPWVMFAEPVHLSLQRDSFSLDWPLSQRISHEEAQGLINDLNRHFHEDGLQFVIGGSGRWYLLLHAPPEIHTCLPEVAAGRLIDDYKLQGAGAPRWQRILNEIQMLLFVHPVNQQREERGEPPINSLWLHSVGRLPVVGAGADRPLLGDAPLVRGLNLLRQAKSYPSCTELEAIKSEECLVYADSELAVRQWSESALRALQLRKIENLTLMLGHDGVTQHFEIWPRDLWKFWRKPRPWKEDFA